jgi:fumarate reductase flavoprotein subunit
MASIEPTGAKQFETTCDVLIVGAGAAGLVAALRASTQPHCHVIVLERDASPRGSTALSAGLIPAAGTHFQRAAGIKDTLATFANDIMHKADDEPDRTGVETVVATVGPVLEWLSEQHDLPFSLITNFNYPGHSAYRMHGLPSRSGAELMDRLRTATEKTGIDIITNATVTTLFAKDRTITGVCFARPDGTTEEVGCKALILACNGYGGNKHHVSAHLPDVSTALYFGHAGNQGEALDWGTQLGAATRHLAGYQGHGSVAHPHGILISWATVMEGGFQVNANGTRFSDESQGYSEQAAHVLAQPLGIAWSIFDARIAGIASQFEDFQSAKTAGAVITAASISELAEKTSLPVISLQETFKAVDNAKANRADDPHGRNWSGALALQAPFCAVKVTGALFHTQGGLVVDHAARVMHSDGKAFPNLFAAGGAACGVSGSKPSGYLSGNGLLTAVAYGYLAGAAAAG